MSMKEDVKILCGKCEHEMKKGILDNYEYEFGFPIKAECYICENCGNITFTEEQADLMKKRTEKLKKSRFGFERKVTYSGKSLTISIPTDLASNLHLKKGEKVRLIPVDQKSFYVELEK